MAFLNDTLTGTAASDLNTHTAESGNTWSRHAVRPSGVMLITTAGTRVRQSSGPAVYVSSWVPASANYIVQARISRLTNQTATAGIGVGGRWSTVTESGYFVRINDPEADGTIVVELCRIDSSVVTVLGSWADTLNASGGTVNIDLELRLRDAEKSVYVNGVKRITSADNTYTTAGRVVLRGGTTNQNDTQGLQWDSIATTDFSVRLPSVSLSGESAMAGVGRLRRFLPAVTLDGQADIDYTAGTLRIVCPDINLDGASEMVGTGGFRFGLNPTIGVLAGGPFEFILGPAEPGLLDLEPTPLGLRIDHADGRAALPVVRDGITVSDPDPYGYVYYRLTITVPDDAGPFMAVWEAEDDDGVREAAELFTVVVPARRAGRVSVTEFAN